MNCNNICVETIIWNSPWVQFLYQTVYQSDTSTFSTPPPPHTIWAFHKYNCYFGPSPGNQNLLPTRCIITSNIYILRFKSSKYFATKKTWKCFTYICHDPTIGITWAEVCTFVGARKSGTGGGTELPVQVTGEGWSTRFSSPSSAILPYTGNYCRHSCCISGPFCPVSTCTLPLLPQYQVGGAAYTVHCNICNQFPLWMNHS